MKSTGKIALTFSIPLLLFGVVFFLLMRFFARDQMVGVTEEPPVAVAHTESAIPLDAESDFWDGIAPTTVHLWPQNARVPYGTEERDVVVRAAYNDLNLGFWLEFEDVTENRESPLNRDACAIFFAPVESPATVQMMGHGTNGNIWHWVADQDAESRQTGDSTYAVMELYTTGPGTQQSLPQQTVFGRGEYRDGRWYVVMKRSLEGLQEDATSISPDSDLLVSIAIWDGEKVEAMARKSISIMTSLVFSQN